MNTFQLESIARVATRVRRRTKNRSQRAARALRAIHAHMEWSKQWGYGGTIDVATVEHIMRTFGATRELRHP